MQSLINVECPHCKTRGQIMVPPVGSIIIGPCPQCSELVVVFCGQVLPLDKALMQDGGIDARRAHLLAALNGFLEERISALMTDDFVLDTRAMDNTSDDANAEGTDFEEIEEVYMEDVSVSSAKAAEADENQTITQSEVDRFTDVDLKLLDNKAYFKSVFGSL